MKLNETIKGVEILQSSRPVEKDCIVESVCTDSRKCTEGSLFVAVRGAGTCIPAQRIT